YKLNGKIIHHPPSDSDALAKCQPVYKTFQGWQTPTGQARSFNQLPPRARDYLKALKMLTGAPINTVSVGAKRNETFSHGS
ncbi:MAG: adenylosuccinate synthetase, partial [bacterium]